MKTTIELVYKCTNYRVNYKGVDYIVSNEYSETESSSGDTRVIMEDSNEKISDELQEEILEAFNQEKE